MLLSLRKGAFSVSLPLLRVAAKLGLISRVGFGWPEFPALFPLKSRPLLESSVQGSFLLLPLGKRGFASLPLTPEAMDLCLCSSWARSLLPLPQKQLGFAFIPPRKQEFAPPPLV